MRSQIYLNQIFILLALMLCTFSSFAQCTATYVLQPNAATGMDAMVNSYPSNVNTNFGTADAFDAEAWTSGGTPFVERSFIRFDLSSIPTNVSVIQATLSLYTSSSAWNGGQHNSLTSSDACWLQAATGSWNQNTITWNNQPSTTTTNQATLAQSTSPTQNYTVDVTNMVQNMVTNPSTNFGMMLRLQNETYYALLQFASSDDADPTKRPLLSVTYSVSVPASISAGGSTTFCQGGSVTLSASPAGTGFSYQWLLNGSTISGATSSSYSATAAGNYSCTVSTSCGSSVSNTIPVIVKLNSSSSTSVTAAGSYTWNGTTYTYPGSYIYHTTNAVGCDSAATLNLTLNCTVTSSTSITACNNYSWNGTLYTAFGSYTYHTTSTYGCDSIATLNLSINSNGNNSTSNTSVTACDSYTWNGITYTNSGSYIYNTTNAAGCDSVATLGLTINKSSTSSTNATACNSYAWNGTTYTLSGIYTYDVGNTSNSASCDSVATLILTIYSSSASAASGVTACSSYTWNGSTYTNSGNYVYHTTNAAGCDSAATLNLTININTSSTSSTSTTACNSYTWNGITYTNSGSYVYHTTNASGCDSAATLNLTINKSSTSVSSATACNSYAWNGTTYTTSSSYVYHTTNAAGCDSAATLNLTVNKSTSSSTSASACDSYTWNGTTYTNSGSYVYHTTNIAGCDFAETLHLTIFRSSTSVTNVTSCYSYTWNFITYTSSGSYIYHTNTKAGCDSAATLNLTINNSSTSTSGATACNSYTWNGTTYTGSGSYIYHTTNAGGCDSAATLNLTINKSSTSASSVTAVGSYTWNGTTYTNSGTYMYYTSNAAGCDSTATLSLIVTNPQAYITLSTDSCGVSGNKIQFRVIISNTGGIAVSLNSMIIRIAFNSAILNGSPTITTNYEGSSNFPLAVQGPNHGGSWTDNYVASTHSMNMTSLPSDYTPSTAVSIPIGGSEILGTFSFTSSTNFNANTPVGLTWITTSGVVLYVNGSTTTTSFNISAGNTTLSPLCGLTTCVAPSSPIAGNNSPICAGGNLNLTSSVSTGNNLTYSWTGPSNFISSAQNPIITAVTTSASGTYSVTISNSCGSATSTTTFVTIYASSTSTASATACNSYSWNGSNYTASGNYTYHTINTAGCDSVATLNLTINTSSTSITNVTAAASYTWNGSTYSLSGNYTYHTTNAAGCDSMAVLNLVLTNLENITLSTDSCGVTGNKIQFRVIISNTGGTVVSLNSMIIRIAFNPAILSGSPTIATNYEGSSDFPLAVRGSNGGGNWSDSYVAATHSMNMTSSTSDYTSSTAVTIPIGGSKILGTFSFTSSADFNANTPVSLTWISTSGVVLYVNGSSTTTNFNTGAGNTTLAPLCDLTTICVAPSSPAAGNNSPICAGASLNLTSSVGGGNSLSYSWTGPNNFTSSAQNPTIVGATVADSGTYTIIISNSCGSATSNTSAAINANSTSTASATACNSYTWNGSNYTTSGSYTYHTINALGCDSAATLNLTITGACPITINLKMFIQGYYVGGGIMNQVLLNEGVDANPNSTNVDTVTISLVDTLFGTVVQTSKAILQTDGSLLVTFPGTVFGKSYYIYIHHRNSIMTSSSGAVAISSNTSYDFSTAASQAFGNNMAQVEPGIWAIYTGDINQDGYIDPYDFPPYDIDNSAQLTGVYEDAQGYGTDLNGDGYVDPYDFPVFDMNNSKQVTVKVPW